MVVLAIGLFNTLFDLYQCCISIIKYTICDRNEVYIMKVFGDLFSDLTGLLTLGIIVFMLVMMAYLFSMFISKSSKKDQ